MSGISEVHDPEASSRLVAEALEDDKRMRPAPWNCVPLIIKLHRDDRRARLGRARQRYRRGARFDQSLGSDSFGVARTRNNLRALANQLKLASEEARQLRALLPICAQCGERPAVCFGHYEGEPDTGPAPACDACCGHGNEDGWCVPLSELPAWATKIRAERDEARRGLARRSAASTSNVPPLDP